MDKSYYAISIFLLVKLWTNMCSLFLMLRYNNCNYLRDKLFLTQIYVTCIVPHILYCRYCKQQTIKKDLSNFILETFEQISDTSDNAPMIVCSNFKNL